MVPEQEKPNKQGFSTLDSAARLSVAPMMDWTDRNCRLFHRQITACALLYTEMVTAPAVIHGNRAHLLDHQDDHPVALQLGGSDPAELAKATRIASDWAYDEVNLNCGCPSDRVQSGAFGAVLMKTPDLVAECVAAMIAVSPVEVTVKCRIGVDDQTPEHVLPRFLETVSKAGVTRFQIHARKAWLQGLSPKDNREIPPLDYALVRQMKAEFPHLHLSINGGIASLSQAKAFLAEGLDGVMLGRAAYHEPFNTRGRAGCGAVRTGHAQGCHRGGRGDAPADRGASGARRAAAPDHPPHAGPVSRPSRRARLAPGAVGRRNRRGRGSRAL